MDIYSKIINAFYNVQLVILQMEIIARNATLVALNVMELLLSVSLVITNNP